VKAKWLNEMRAADRCPEKAGVGGSIPSLATTSFQRLSATSVLKACLCGVHLESKLGYHSKIALSLLAPIFGSWHQSLAAITFPARSVEIASGYAVIQDLTQRIPSQAAYSQAVYKMESETSLNRPPKRNRCAGNQKVDNRPE